MSVLVLIGPPGALTTDVAHELSARHGIPSAATDEAIEALAGRTLDQIAIYGEPGELRALERDVSVALLRDAEESLLTGNAHHGDSDERRILALGSGCLGDTPSDEYFVPVRTLLARVAEEGAVVVYLYGDFSTLVRRINLDGPRLAAVSSPRKIFYEQLALRAPVYEEAASQSIDTSGMTVTEATDAVEALFFA